MTLTLPTTPESVALTARHGLIRTVGDNVLLHVPQAVLIAAELRPDTRHQVWIATDERNRRVRAEYFRIGTREYHPTARTHYWVRATCLHTTSALTWQPITLCVGTDEQDGHTVWFDDRLAESLGIEGDWNGWFNADCGVHRHWIP